MRARDLVEADIERGDFGSARHRLGSRVSSAEYSPELLARIAELSREMRDPAQAGRYWMLSAATGPQVEEAIAAFARSCGYRPHHMASELPRFRHRYRLAQYPLVVRERLTRFGIDEVLRQQDPSMVPIQASGWKDRAKFVGCLAVLGGLGALIVLGLRALGRAWCG